MPWFNVDDGFPFHRKVVAAGNAAIGLWTRAGAWSAKELTEGFVPDHMVPTMGTATQADKLVVVGLWVRVDRGFQFHEWTTDGRNPTREEVLERRRKDRVKKAKARDARSAKGPQENNSQVEDSCPPGTNEGRPEGIPVGTPEGVGSTTPLPSTPGTELKKTSSSSGRAKRGTRMTEDFTVTPAMVAWARERCPQVNGKAETEKFINHWQAKSGRDATKVDWPATWRNWMLHALERLPAARAAAPSPTDAFAAQFLSNPQPTLELLPGGETAC